jgi:hypothetical protein
MPPKDLSQERMPSRNIAQPVYFILKGAEKRRTMATRKAKHLQRELGVIPKLTSVK